MIIGENGNTRVWRSLRWSWLLKNSPLQKHEAVLAARCRALRPWHARGVAGQIFYARCGALRPDACHLADLTCADARAVARAVTRAFACAVARAVARADVGSDDFGRSDAVADAGPDADFLVSDTAADVVTVDHTDSIADARTDDARADDACADAAADRAADASAVD